MYIYLRDIYLYARACARLNCIEFDAIKLRASLGQVWGKKDDATAARFKASPRAFGVRVRKYTGNTPKQRIGQANKEIGGVCRYFWRGRAPVVLASPKNE